MKKFCFLIDTSFDFNYDLGPDVYILPQEIIKTVNGKDTIYQDTVDIKRNDVKKLLASNAELRTSQIPYGKIQLKMEELLEEYEKIYCIVITKEFSGTFATFNKIADQLQKVKGKNRILVIDSKATAIDQNWILQLVRDEANKGSTFSAIEKAVKNFNTKIHGFTIISNATQLIKGGRLTGIKALLVKALNIKLVIRYMHGGLKFLDKSRTMEGAIDKGIVDAFEQLKIPKNKIDKIVIFSDLKDPNETQKYVKYVQNKLNDFYNGKYENSLFPTIVLTHLGDFSFSVMIKIK